MQWTVINERSPSDQLPFNDLLAASLDTVPHSLKGRLHSARFFILEGTETRGPTLGLIIKLLSKRKEEGGQILSVCSSKR